MKCVKGALKNEKYMRDWQIDNCVVCFALFSDLSVCLRRSRWYGIDWKGNAVRCCSSPRYCKKDDSFAGARSGTTVLRLAVWEGREEDDFEPGDLLDRDRHMAFWWKQPSVGGSGHGNVSFVLNFFRIWSLCTAECTEAFLWYRKMLVT